MSRDLRERSGIGGAWLGAALVALMGLGADVYGSGTLLTGLVFASLIIPVFIFRHYIQDKGRFPKEAGDLNALGGGGRVTKRAGILPYLAVVAGVTVVVVMHRLAVY